MLSQAQPFFFLPNPPLSPIEEEEEEEQKEDIHTVVTESPEGVQAGHIQSSRRAAWLQCNGLEISRWLRSDGFVPGDDTNSSTPPPPSTKRKKQVVSQIKNNQ